MAMRIIWEDDSGETQTIRFDVVRSENHELLNAVTQHPVEEGQNVTDHIRPELDQFSCEGFVSMKPLFQNPGTEEFMDFEVQELDLPPRPGELPITPGALTRAVVSAVGSLFSTPQTTAMVLHPSEFKDRVREMHDALRDVRDNGRLVRIVTRLGDYEGMAITRVGVPRSAENGTGVAWQLDFTQIRSVKSETVEAPDPAELRGQLASALGSQNVGPAKSDAAKAKKAKSIAAKLFDGASGGLSDLVGF